MRKTVFLLLLCLLLPFAALGEKYAALPPYQHVVQTSERVQRSRNNVSLTRMHIRTANGQVTAALEAELDAMQERAVLNLPGKPVNPQEGAPMYVGTTVTRTGEKWMGFLLSANLLDGREQTYVDFAAHTYDMETGAELTLRDVMDAAAYPLLQEQAKAQLMAYYAAEAADVAVLEALISDLESIPFTLDAAFLQLHFRADALYPGHASLMHVRIPYSLLSAYLTEAARVQTDNSGYKLVALTFDDGPTRGVTRSIALDLRRQCAGATFFIVGSRIAFGHDLLCFAHDLGFTQAGHSYTHRYVYNNRNEVYAEYDRFVEEFSHVTGEPIRMMRAPGGNEAIFVQQQIGLPLIHWSFSAGDTAGKITDAPRHARLVASMIKDGDILLCHDLFPATAEMVQTLPQLLTDRGFLCVTLEELFACRGVELLPNTVYYSAE